MIIGILGLAGSGKTLVAKHLVEEYEFERMRFADPIKRMLRLGLGLTDEEIDGEAKMTPNAVFGGVTPRHLMQTLGTEWGRRNIHTDIWVNVWRRDVALQTGNVVVDDVRFPNEAAAIRAMGGVLWRVYRPGLTMDSHVSERMQQNITEDHLINNATSITALLNSTDHLIKNLA